MYDQIGVQIRMLQSRVSIALASAASSVGMGNYDAAERQYLSVAKMIEDAMNLTSKAKENARAKK